MSEKLREALSAAVDGEASEFELRRVFDEMSKDDSLSSAWQSYHLIKQAAQGENVQAVPEMGERIWAALDSEEFLQQDIVQEEPLVEPPVTSPSRRFGVAGGAMAAALALGVVLWGNFGGAPDGAAPAAQIAQDSSVNQTLAPQDGSNESRLNEALGASDAQVASVPSVDQRGGVLPVGLASAVGDLPDDYDYGPGFVPFSELSAEDRARSEGYFLHHVQHQAVNNDNVLSFVKMISYPQ